MAGKDGTLSTNQSRCSFAKLVYDRPMGREVEEPVCMAAWRVFTPDCKTILSLLVIWENMISALSTLTIEQQNLHFVNTQIVYLDFSK